MCKVTVDEKTNPDFVLYNLVFSNNKIGKLTSSNLGKVMNAYGFNMPESDIQNFLSVWYKRGLLSTRGGSYVVA